MNCIMCIAAGRHFNRCSFIFLSMHVSLSVHHSRTRRRPLNQAICRVWGKTIRIYFNICSVRRGEINEVLSSWEPCPEYSRALPSPSCPLIGQWCGTRPSYWPSQEIWSSLSRVMENLNIQQSPPPAKYQSICFNPRSVFTLHAAWLLPITLTARSDRDEY